MAMGPVRLHHLPSEGLRPRLMFHDPRFIIAPFWGVIDPVYG